MTITLPPELDRFLQAEVAAGRFSSVSEAVYELVRELRQKRALAELRAEIHFADEESARGETTSLKDEAELRDFMTSLRQQWASGRDSQQGQP